MVENQDRSDDALAAQAKLPTSEDFAERLRFLKLDEQAGDLLRSSKAVLMAAMPSILDDFYKKLADTPQTARFFEREDVARRAKSKQTAHWDQMTNGVLDDAYLNSVLRIGETHEHIGLAPHLYMGACAFVLDRLASALITAHWPKSYFGRREQGREIFAAQFGVLIRTAILDMELTVSVYLAVFDMRGKQNDARNKQITDRVLETMRQVTDRLSRGDLTCRIGEDFPAAYDELRHGFNAALDKLTDSIKSLHENAVSVTIAIDRISAASEDMSRRTEAQAASLEQSTAALNEMTEAMRQTSNGIVMVNESVKAANEGADSVSKVVNEAGLAMEQIDQSSKKIRDIIGLIDEIAFQTNLLALNAGVEAARAGEAGRGFAVVAQEVRALAQRSADAAREIKSLISTSEEKVSLGVELVQKSGAGLADITHNIAEISGLTSTIADNSRGQSIGLAQINQAITTMGQDVQKNAEMAEKISISIGALRGEVEALNETANSFKLNSL